MNIRVRVKDVHTEHCCYRHGCKYGVLARTPCTVTTGAQVWQSLPCEICDVEIREVWDVAHLENEVLVLRARVSQLELEKEDEYWNGYDAGLNDER